MKALMGKKIAEIRKDSKGSDEIRRFVSSGDDKVKVQLSNGKVYWVSKVRNAQSSASKS